MCGAFISTLDGRSDFCATGWGALPPREGAAAYRRRGVYRGGLTAEKRRYAAFRRKPEGRIPRSTFYVSNVAQCGHCTHKRGLGHVGADWWPKGARARGVRPRSLSRRLTRPQICIFVRRGLSASKRVLSVSKKGAACAAPLFGTYVGYRNTSAGIPGYRSQHFRVTCHCQREPSRQSLSLP